LPLCFDAVVVVTVEDEADSGKELLRPKSSPKSLPGIMLFLSGDGEPV
jgi:hypothetical protein